MSLYLEHFGLREAPFTISPNPHFLFMSRQHREALAHLQHGLAAGGGIIVLTGEVGAGKTTISRRLIETLPDNADMAWIVNPRLDARELLAAICAELGIAHDAHASTHKLGDAINRWLLENHARGRDTLLMIDEAQHLGREALEQVRLLTNLETNEKKLLQILLIGQPELRGMLARRDMRQIEQRIVARFHLQPLSRGDTARMVEHRWRVAGGQAFPFTRCALLRLHRESGGIPRLINLIADRALLGAYAANDARVRARHILRAAREIRGEARPRAGYARLAAALGMGLLGGMALAAFLQPPAPTAPDHSPQAAAQHAAPPEQTAANEATPSPPQTPAADEAIVTGSHAQALTTLAHLWEPALPGPVRDCAALANARLACLTLEGGIARLRSMDRPALLHLAGNRGEGDAVLAALDGNTAELLLETPQGLRRQRIPIAELEQRRDARFMLLWRAPRGWKEPIRPGDRGPIVAWLNRQLDRAVGELIPPAGDAMDARAVARLREFQRREGLRPDGAAGPLTLIRLNDALRLPRPSLRHPGSTGEAAG